MRTTNDNYYLGTWGFPSAGWWAVHAVGIAAIYFYGYKKGKADLEEDYE